MSIENIKKLREMTGAGMMDVKKALDASNDDINLAIDWLRKNGVAKAAKKSGRIAAEGIISIVSNSQKIVIVEINSETDFVASNAAFKKGAAQIAIAILDSSLKSDDLVGANELKTPAGTVAEVIAELTSTIGEKISLRRFAIFNLKDQSVGFYVHSNSKIGAIVIGTKMESSLLRDIAMHVAAMSPQFLSMEDISKETKAKETALAKELLKDTLASKPEKVQEGIIRGKVNKTLGELILLEQPFVKDPSKKVKDLQGQGKIDKFIRYEVGEGIQKADNNFADEVAAQLASAKK